MGVGGEARYRVAEKEMGFEEGEAERKKSEAVRPKLKGKGRTYRHLHCRAGYYYSKCHQSFQKKDQKALQTE